MEDRNLVFRSGPERHLVLAWKRTLGQLGERLEES
jgi:hypothetical protein